MKKQIFLLLLLALIFTQCRTTNILPSQYEKEIVIDGSIADWPTLTKVKVKDQTSYGVYNDDENVYLLFRTYDEKLVEKISNMGMTVWVDGNGGKSKDIGMRYSSRQRMRRGNGRNRMGPQNLDEETDRPASRRAGVIRGLKKVDSRYELVDMTDGAMNAALSKHTEGTYLIYEAQFSLSLIREFARKKNIEKGKLSFLIEVGPVGLEGNRSMDGRQGRMSGSGMAMRGGMGMRGGGGFGGGMGMSRSPGGMGRMGGMPSESNTEEIYIKSLLTDV